VRHLLLVEDNSSDVLLIREALRRCSVPADVVIAYDGEQAIRVLERDGFRPDLIVLDLNLPKRSGFDVLKSLQGETKAPVAVFTGSSSESDRELALNLGAREYITKPKSFDGYMKAIRGILQRWWPHESSAAASVS
jgi:DNA-binding response OmpR family regulator